MNEITRRKALQGSVVLAGAGVLPAAKAAEPFTGATVRQAARALAKQPFREPDAKLPGAAASMTYDQYRGIRFKQERALWRGQELPFQVAFFPRGFLYRTGVDIHEVRDGQAARIPSSPDLFDYDDPSVRVPDDLAVVGCDDIRLASLVTPALTTLRVDKQALGRRAVALLLDRLNGLPEEATVVQKPELVVRASAP